MEKLKVKRDCEKIYSEDNRRLIFVFKDEHSWYEFKDNCNLYSDMEYVDINDKPCIITYVSGGVDTLDKVTAHFKIIPIKKDFKHDKGKLFVSLVDPFYIEDIAKVLTFGAEKYSKNSWQTLEDAETRYKDALLRHLLAYLKGELIDADSGLTHLAHIGTNVMFLSHFERLKCSNLVLND